VLQAAYPEFPLEHLQKMFNDKLARMRDQLPSITCPLNLPIPPALQAEKLDPVISDAPTEQLRVLMNDLDRLPACRGGFQQWYPPEVVATAK
jgi:hypothetical protein